MYIWRRREGGERIWVVVVGIRGRNLGLWGWIL